MKIGFLHSLIRKDEKFLLKELKSRNDVETVMVDDRKLTFNLGKDRFDFTIALERCINHSRALHVLKLFETSGIKCVNQSKVALICGDKLLTSNALTEWQIPQPEVRVAFTEESALQANLIEIHRGLAIFQCTVLSLSAFPFCIRNEVNSMNVL